MPDILQDSPIRATYPLLRFKSSERLLTIGPDGVSTTIGTLSGHVPWSKVARIDQDGERVYIVGKTGNSFVVPSAAFASDVERAQFVGFARQRMEAAAATT